MTKYGIWLSFNNQQEGFQIPVNPGSIELSDGSKGKTYDIENLGEINVIKNRKLTTYSFSSLFPAQKYPFIVADTIFRPNEYVRYIEKWMESKRPIRFVFTGDSFDINTAASIEGFDWKEVAGGGGDIEYTLKLKKYVFYTAQRVQVITDSDTPVIQMKPVERPNDRQPPKIHRLAPGENLWVVAKKFLGDGSLWKEIQELNNIPDSELKKLPVGLALELPQDMGGVTVA